MFDYTDESDGTKRLFDLIPLFYENRKVSVTLIDEIDRSLHTNLTRKFLELFYRTDEKKDCQLIATTHDSNLLDLDLLRKDEIWFVERQNDHNSKVFSLNKFKERFDKKIDKEYLIGGLSIYNSCFYEKALSQIEFIKFDNDNNIIDTVFPSEYLNDEKEFIFPGSAFTYDIKDIKAKRVIIGFNCGSETNLSEISIYGKTAWKKDINY